MPSEWLAMSGREAAQHGAVVSFRNAYDETWSWTHSGPVIEVVRDACDAALLRDQSYRVTSVSTPTSIYADLQGRPAGAVNGFVQNVERSLLSRAKRKHMLHPELLGDFSK